MSRVSEELRMAGVFAHPDDDTHGIGGLLALRPDVEVMLVIATSGESGLIVDPAAATRDTLAEVREREELDALAELGRGDVEVRFLGYPDGGVAVADPETCVGEVVDALLDFRPDVVVTFGADGITRHEDHVAVHRLATEAFHRARERARAEGDERSFRRLFYHLLPQSQVDAFLELRRAAGEPVDADAPFVPRGVPDEQVHVRVDIAPVADRKVAALVAHRTQPSALRDLPEALRPRGFRYEWLAQAWPAREDRRGEWATDPFEGL